MKEPQARKQKGSGIMDKNEKTKTSRGIEKWLIRIVLAHILIISLFSLYVRYGERRIIEAITMIYLVMSEPLINRLKPKIDFSFQQYVILVCLGVMTFFAVRFIQEGDRVLSFLAFIVFAGFLFYLLSQLEKKGGTNMNDSIHEISAVHHSTY